MSPTSYLVRPTHDGFAALSETTWSRVLRHLPVVLLGVALSALSLAMVALSLWGLATGASQVPCCFVLVVPSLVAAAARGARRLAEELFGAPGLIVARGRLEVLGWSRVWSVPLGQVLAVEAREHGLRLLLADGRVRRVPLKPTSDGQLRWLAQAIEHSRRDLPPAPPPPPVELQRLLR